MFCDVLVALIDLGLVGVEIEKRRESSGCSSRRCRVHVHGEVVHQFRFLGVFEEANRVGYVNRVDSQQLSLQQVREIVVLESLHIEQALKYFVAYHCRLSHWTLQLVIANVVP